LQQQDKKIKINFLNYKKIKKIKKIKNLSSCVSSMGVYKKYLGDQTLNRVIIFTSGGK